MFKEEEYWLFLYHKLSKQLCKDEAVV
jgi:hypothetical protein